MSDDDNQQDAPEPVLQVPEPPPPADIGGGEVSTHSRDDSAGTTFATESKDDN